MDYEPEKHGPVTPVQVDIAVGEGHLRAKVPAPVGPTQASDLMPLFRSLSEAVIHLSVMGVEKTGKKVSCHDGCAACCRHLVPLSYTEAFALLDMIEAMPQERREWVKQRFRQAAGELRSAGMAEILLNPRRASGREQLDMGTEYYKLYLDCPFLENERCTVYDERPIVCREFLMTSPAENCRPLREPLERVPISVGANRGLFWLFREPGEMQAPWVALAMLMEWADRRPTRPAPEPGHELVRRFVERMNEPR